MAKDIIIIWAWSEWDIIEDMIHLIGNYHIVWFLDDRKEQDTRLKPKNIIWPISDIHKHLDTCCFFVSIGNNGYRNTISNKILSAGGILETLIHPSAVIENNVDIDVWCRIWAKTYINSYSSIGQWCIINNGVIIEHHNTIGKYCHLAPWTITWWFVSIDEQVFLWLWSIVNDRVHIAQWVYAWSGTVINKNVIKESKIVWVPYRYL